MTEEQKLAIRHLGLKALIKLRDIYYPYPRVYEEKSYDFIDCLSDEIVEGIYVEYCYSH